MTTEAWMVEHNHQKFNFSIREILGDVILLNIQAWDIKYSQNFYCNIVFKDTSFYALYEEPYEERHQFSKNDEMVLKIIKEYVLEEVPKTSFMMGDGSKEKPFDFFEKYKRGNTEINKAKFLRSC